jgi:hypothetical protein
MQDAQLVLVFGDHDELATSDWLREVSARHPSAHVVSCSTSGEISGTEVSDGSIVATALAFDSSSAVAVAVDVNGPGASASAGARIAASLEHDGLKHVLVFSEGLQINGSELAAGMRDGLPGDVVVTGGLAGDGARMQHTSVGLDDVPRERRVVAVGLYGPRLRVGHGSLGGWDPFGPEREVTRAEGNVLFELDGRSALELYKTYLGDHAAGLPSSGLLFPLAVRPRHSEASLVRTILGIDEARQSITFAGDIPTGSVARLMRANFDRLVDGAVGAARGCLRDDGARGPSFALLVSCVGRKLVLGQRVEEEVEAVREVLGPDAVLGGFYSFGEICPHVASPRCELHNQTMTITTLAEA